MWLSQSCERNVAPHWIKFEIFGLKSVNNIRRLPWLLLSFLLSEPVKISFGQLLNQLWISFESALNQLWMLRAAKWIGWLYYYFIVYGPVREKLGWIGCVSHLRVISSGCHDWYMQLYQSLVTAIQDVLEFYRPYCQKKTQNSCRPHKTNSCKVRNAVSLIRQLTCLKLRNFEELENNSSYFYCRVGKRGWSSWFTQKELDS